MSKFIKGDDVRCKLHPAYKSRVSSIDSNGLITIETKFGTKEKPTYSSVDPSMLFATPFEVGEIVNYRGMPGIKCKVNRYDNEGRIVIKPPKGGVMIVPIEHVFGV